MRRRVITVLAKHNYDRAIFVCETTDQNIILLRHLLEGSCEIAVRMRTSVRYFGRTSRLRLWQLVKNRGFFLSFSDL